MAMMLGTKTFLIDKTVGMLPVGRIKEWFNAIERDPEENYDLVVRLESRGNERKKKSSASRQLEALATATPGMGRFWSSGDYSFDFLARDFHWKKEEVHLTASEALFLYYLLMCSGAVMCKSQRYLLRNMRRRLGKEFLADTLEITGGTKP